jgi:hypothetical protein
MSVAAAEARRADGKLGWRDDLDSPDRLSGDWILLWGHQIDELRSRPVVGRWIDNRREFCGVDDQPLSIIVTAWTPIPAREDPEGDELTRETTIWDLAEPKPDGPAEIVTIEAKARDMLQRWPWRYARTLPPGQRAGFKSGRCRVEMR